MRCRRLRCVAWRTAISAACRRWEQQIQARCRQWETTWQLLCERWETTWTQQCRQWETTWQQVCREWETRQEQRCDRWEQEQRRVCDSWHPLLAWICLIWATVTTWVCRAWVWVTTTLCKAWEWVSTTLCKLWAWVSTTLCKLWAWVTTTLCKLFELFTTFVCRLWEFVTTLICTVFAWFVDLVCVIVCWFRRLRAPNEVSEATSECVYGWTTAFRIDERDCTITITLRIRLNPDPGVTQQQLQTARTTWEQAIEQAWTDRFRIRLVDGNCRCREYRVVLDVQWVTANEHHTVRIRTGTGRANMTTWFITSTGGTAAHEAGHMLGNPDEYADPACPGRTVTNDGSIMQTSQTGTVRPRHYTRFARWISDRTCCEYEVREGD
ncbi:MAG TPA: hypothetical protein VFL61_09600 [Gaiellaceae bacterium]|nr:hypothetical protein [Gaiellaceae bacterium]